MRPRNEIVQYQYQNPHASMPLIIPMLVMCNTPDEVLGKQIRESSLNHHRWLQQGPVDPRPAIMIGGGASVADYVDEIREMAGSGCVVFAMNGASRWARAHGIRVDYQVICDAKQETSLLVDHDADHHLFASQCHRDTLSVDRLTLWHLDIGNVEQYLPSERVKQGGYVLIGGGASVGNSALCVAFAMGFRKMRIFGYDSSNRGDETHAYPQPMNKLIPVVPVTWGGKTYQSSVAMKAQAEKFQITSAALTAEGCELTVYGDGLLQQMYNTKPECLCEREKYQLLWQFEAYRGVSPGEHVADLFLSIAKPDSLVVDYGCGTGRGALAIANQGIPVLLVDFTDNCRDEEAQSLPFIQWDLSIPFPGHSRYGFCTDVLEHIPPEAIDLVMANIMDASVNTFFQISTIDDIMGEHIGQHLHLIVEPHEWWRQKITDLGYQIQWEQEGLISSCFYVTP